MEEFVEDRVVLEPHHGSREDWIEAARPAARAARPFRWPGE